MEKIVTNQCPKCGGQLTFDNKLGNKDFADRFKAKVKCNKCGYRY